MVQQKLNVLVCVLLVCVRIVLPQTRVAFHIHRTKNTSSPGIQPSILAAACLSLSFWLRYKGVILPNGAFKLVVFLF